MAVIKSIGQALEHIESGKSIMIGGFLGVGAPLKLIDEIANSSITDLTIISAVASNPYETFDIGKLTKKNKIKKFIGAHIGTDPNLVKQYNEGKVEVEFNPMGTLIERIRAAGSGLGGILTPTGLGTEMEQGREKIMVNGKPFLLYPPLKADIAIVKAYRADKFGNLQYKGVALNSNPIIATAADLVIAEVDEIVKVGEIAYNDVGTPGIFVDIIVKGNDKSTRKKIYEDLWINAHKL